MSDEDEDEISRLEDLCDHYELQWRRACMGAQAANKGIRRLQAKMESMKAALAEAQDDVAYEGGLCARLKHENAELKKKVQRLSLRILDMWGREGVSDATT